MKISALTLMLAAVAAPAWPAAAVNDKLAACTQIQDAQQRLACFDREMSPPGKIKAPTTTPAPAAVPAIPPRAVVAPAPPIAVPPEPTLGEEQLGMKSRPRVKQEIQTLHAHITAMRTLAPSTYAVTLDNGQTWRHENEQLGSYLRSGDAITISKAPVIGTYRLTRDAGKEKDWIRVTRIR